MLHMLLPRSKPVTGKYSFSEDRTYKNYCSLSFMTKYDKFLSFYHWLNDFKNFAARTVKAKMKKEKNTANLYNKLLTIYFNDYS